MPANAYRITPVPDKELDRNGALRNLAMHYVQALMTQMAQTVVCNRHHPVAQQLCRWLLLSLDRLPSNVIMMTDGLVANMLGVRLRGVMTAAGKLEGEGIIEYHDGRITVLSRAKMEKRACVCYRIVRDEEIGAPPEDREGSNSRPPPTPGGPHTTGFPRPAKSGTGQSCICGQAVPT